MFIIGPDVDRNTMLVEAVLENFSDVQDWMLSYGVDIREECIGAKN